MITPVSSRRFASIGRCLVLGTVMVAALFCDAGANGRAPATSTIHFRLGHESDIAAGMTFGLVVSHDNGITWHWMCEKAVGYGGIYDPQYTYTSQGSLFATTFDGLKKNSDGCVFAPTLFGSSFVSVDGLGSDNALYVALGDVAQPNAVPPHPGDSNIYKSTDDGTSFPVRAMPGMVGDWWQSMFVAPADPSHVYLTGYRLSPPAPTVFLLFESTDGGASYTALSTTGLTTSNNSVIEIVGATNAGGIDSVYARVTLENGTSGEGLYKSTNGGTSWTKILAKNERIHFVARASGDLVAATQFSGTQTSSDGGTTWTNVAGAPHINCLYENAAGELWACTLNYDVMGSPPTPGDGYGIMKSTNLTSWTGVLKFQDILAPVACPSGTAQHEMCEPSWCALKDQLGITSTAVDCPLPFDTSPEVRPKGCCDTGSGSGPLALSLGAAVFLLVIRPRRRNKN